MTKFFLNQNTKAFVTAQQLQTWKMKGHFCPTFSFFYHFKSNLPYYAEFVKLQPSYLPTTLSALSFALSPATPTHTVAAFHPISGTIESERLKGGFGGGHQQPPGEAACRRVAVELARGHGCPVQMVLLCTAPRSAHLPCLLRYSGKGSELWGVSWHIHNVLSVCSRSNLEHILKSPPSAEQGWPYKKLVQNNIDLRFHTLNFLDNSLFPGWINLKMEKSA